MESLIASDDLHLVTSSYNLKVYSVEKEGVKLFNVHCYKRKSWQCTMGLVGMYTDFILSPFNRKDLIWNINHIIERGTRAKYNIIRGKFRGKFR